MYQIPTIQEILDLFKNADKDLAEAIHEQPCPHSFAVVITDLGMPEVDGRKVASTIKAASPLTPVIMLTGWGERLVAEGDVPIWALNFRLLGELGFTR